MMPACTGLPPGELIRSTTPLAPSSSKAVFMAATTNSALASAPLAISPLISTTAVCAVVLAVAGEPRETTSQTRKMKKASQLRRTKVFQRRAACCSRRLAKASFSSVVRSQPGCCVGSFLEILRDAAARSKGSKPSGSVRLGSVMSESQGLEVPGSMPVDHPVPFTQHDLDQPAAAGTSGAFAGLRLVDRSVRRAQQPSAAVIEETVRLEIELHRNMAAAVQV